MYDLPSSGLIVFEVLEFYYQGKGEKEAIGSVSTVGKRETSFATYFVIYLTLSGSTSAVLIGGALRT